MKVLIDRFKCNLCKLCIEYCPAYVFYIVNRSIIAEEWRCIECYGCIALCPMNAISIREQ
ncbi:MAG: 4Fe-4S dicluster domain-containing protein [Sulfolobales archaeon]|nr:4Fe-4S dicluster domain-containing protein [Sulfolobales archaeon]MCX8199415.1 4Fe-4S dicluster domain-containing protein [Sulfolobales archaeon]MDW8170271.1 4Fe-4S dicluster domain-containing protein [Desulfurococcaceae archaeon]